MTGFKEGAAASGFDDEDESGSAAADTADESGGTADERETETAGSSAATASGSDTEAADSTASGQRPNAGQLPWIYRRDNARDGRPRTKQIHLQPATAEQESAFRSEVETALGESVNLTDLREASLLVAMDHVEEVADQLREWGYDFN